MKSIMCAAMLLTLPVFAGEMTAERHKAELDKLLTTMQQTIQRGPYEPTGESLNRHVAPDWYADAKLGIFIHYGLFSVPGYSGSSCWYGNQMYDSNNVKGVYAFHRQRFGAQDKFGYKDFAPLLTASAFDADEWVSLFKEGGARFVVPVSCFHDGFAMWDSKLTDWNAVKMGPKRDYDGLLTAAARKQGLKFGVSWHAFMRPYFFAPGIVGQGNCVRRSLGCAKGQDAGFPSDLAFTWRGAAHQEGEVTFFRGKISRRGRTTTAALDAPRNERRPHNRGSRANQPPKEVVIRRVGGYHK